MSVSSDGGADQDQNPAEDFNRSFLGGPVLKQPAPYSYLSLNDGAESNPEGVCFDMSPLSSPENEPGKPTRILQNPFFGVSASPLMLYGFYRLTD